MSLLLECYCNREVPDLDLMISKMHAQKNGIISVPYTDKARLISMKRCTSYIKDDNNQLKPCASIMLILMLMSSYLNTSIVLLRNFSVPLAGLCTYHG